MVTCSYGISHIQFEDSYNIKKRKFHKIKENVENKFNFIKKLCFFLIIIQAYFNWCKNFNSLLLKPIIYGFSYMHFECLNLHKYSIVPSLCYPPVEAIYGFLWSLTDMNNLHKRNSSWKWRTLTHPYFVSIWILRLRETVMYFVEK